ncbi:MAG: 2-dehydropantoate 2-reductase [Firmicutes bacterium]|nr:2-dehydropantoate 2-reductase [Bacillota bacterium]
MPLHTDADGTRIAVFGAGAVGCYFGGMLARAGLPVTLIGRPHHVEAIRTRGLFLDTLQFQQSIPVAAATSPEAARDAAFVLFSVKSYDTETAARALAPHLSPSAQLVSLQNGVDNVVRIHAATGRHALPAVVYVAAAMAGPGHVQHSGQGRLVVGRLPEQPAELESRAAQLASLFQHAGVPCDLTENIQGELWAKLVINCAGNAVSALTRASYARAAAHEPTREVMRATAQEAIAVARAAGISLPAADLVEKGLQLAHSLGPATSSTEQDIARGKRTEIDALNGLIVRRGRELGVPTPVNHTLWALVKLLEASLLG